MATDPHVEDRRRAEEERKWRRNQNAAAQKEAEKELHKIELDRIRARERAEKERIAAARAADVAAAAEEKEILSAPVRRRAGATRRNKGSVIVWHWLAEPPTDVVMQQRRRGLGPLIALKPGGGQFAADDAVYASLKRRYPDIATEHPEYVASIRKALTETNERYGDVLTKLRDDGAMAKLFESSEVCLTDRKKTTEVGEYGSYSREVTTVDIPELIEVAVEPDGLVLIFKHRPGDSSKRWFAKIDLLRNLFRSLGADAANLKIVDDEAGNIRLEFNDAPNIFPKAVASGPVTAPQTMDKALAEFPNLRWEFGVDARGNPISARIRDNPHLALIAQTNWGKSVLSASLIERLRPFGAWWIFDGKGSDHPTTLAEQPGIAWISKDAPEHVVGMKWLHDEMEERYLEADARKTAGRGGKAFEFPPIFVLVDETPSLRGGIDALGKGGLDTFDFWVQDLLQKGRQCRIHVVIISQSLYVDSVPSKWQTNLTRIVFLGPVSGRSLMSDAVPESARTAVQEMTARIPESAKGRGVYLDTSGGSVKPVQIQTFYDFAPGTTDLAMAPTPEVAAIWQQQQAGLANRPVLFDRIGIRVPGPDWRKLSVDELAELPTVIVSDERGVIEGMEVYDPLSPAFLGRVRITANRNRARGRGSGVTAEPSEHEPADPSLLAALEEAQKRGLIPPAAAPNSVVGEV